MSPLPSRQPDFVRQVVDAIDAIDEVFAQIAHEVELILATMPDTPLTDVDRQHLLRFIEPRLREVFGATPADAASSRLFDLVLDESLRTVERTVLEAIDDVGRIVRSARPDLWRLIEDPVQIGPPGPMDAISRLQRMFAAPEVQKKRDLVATYFDPQRRFAAADGYRLSDRVWRSGRAVRSEIDRIVQEAIAKGTNPNAAVKQLREYLDPARNPVRYGRDGRIIRREGERFSRADIKRANNDARRIMRTEMKAAQFEATRISAGQVPGVIGLRYNLSNRHPVRDACDQHAERDAYGMGRGVYPINLCPRIPIHPQCLCFGTHVHMETADLISLFEREAFLREAA